MMSLKSLTFSERDLEFLIETASPGVMDRYRLKQIIREDEDFRNRFMKIFKRLKSL
jgi:hypothetical protein